MKKISRLTTVVTGACGLLLAAGVASPAAQASNGPTSDSIQDSNTSFSFGYNFACSNSATACVNGSSNSGNLINSQNLRPLETTSTGTVTITQSNGNTNSNNSYTAPSSSSGK